MFNFFLFFKKLDQGVLRITGAFVFRHLFVGEKQSVLMDTGYGIADLPKLVETYIDSPLTVINSHYHPDHSGGNLRFKDVHIHPADMPFTGELSIEHLVHTIGMAVMDRSDTRRFVAKTAGKLFRRTHRARTNYTPMPDGTEFDLGDRKLVVRWLPGHTEGSCVLLDPDRHTIYTGDACNTGFWMWTNPKMTLAEYADNLDAFYNDIKDQGYEKLYNCHTPMANKVSFITDFAAFARSIRKGDRAVRIHLPGFPDDPLCIRGRMSLKHMGPMLCFYFESQAAGDAPARAALPGKKLLQLLPPRKEKAE